MQEDGHKYHFGSWPEMPWKRKEDSVYTMTVVQIPGEWRGRQVPLEAPSGCRLHSFVYASPERILCVWERDPILTARGVLELDELADADDWGGSARVGAEAV